MMSTLDALPAAVKAFAPADFRKVSTIVKDRMQMFLKPHAVIANILDHRYRGQQLPAEAKAAAYAAVPNLCHCLGIPAQSLDDIADFVAGHGLFAQCQALPCSPHTLWTTVLSAEALSPFATILAGLPSSQASVERVFSSASWMVEGRTRLGLFKLSRDVVMRWNLMALARK